VRVHSLWPACSTHLCRLLPVLSCLHRVVQTSCQLGYNALDALALGDRDGAVAIPEAAGMMPPDAEVGSLCGKSCSPDTAGLVTIAAYTTPSI
jgi:hypothetical protein